MSERQTHPDTRLVLDFVNTRDHEGVEHLTSLRDLTAWLREHGLFPRGARLQEADLERTRVTREAIRAIVRATRRGDPAPADAIASVNTVLASVSTSLRFGADGHGGLVLDGAPVDLALASILEAFRRSQESEDADRVKVCRNDECQWAYFDTSKNRSRIWCHMAVCGSRAKARAYRARTRSRAT